MILEEFGKAVGGEAAASETEVQVRRLLPRLPALPSQKVDTGMIVQEESGRREGGDDAEGEETVRKIREKG